MLEEKGKPGAVAVGTRTMQEGGALGPWTREQVELFCVDNLVRPTHPPTHPPTRPCTMAHSNQLIFPLAHPYKPHSSSCQPPRSPPPTHPPTYLSQMMVEINSSEDWIVMDFTFPTKSVDEDDDFSYQQVSPPTHPPTLSTLSTLSTQSTHSTHPLFPTHPPTHPPSHPPTQ